MDQCGGPMNAMVFGVPVLHIIVLLIGNTTFLSIYALQSSFFEQYKISKKPWAWLSPDMVQRNQFWSLVRSSLLTTTFNVLLTIPLSAMNYDLSVKLGYSATAQDIPSLTTIVRHIFTFMVIEDTMFYWGHRLLHQYSYLYLNIHKYHHKWVQSISLSAEATNFIEFVISNVIPFATGPLFCGAHLLEIYMWTIWRIGETITNHSGYDFPWTVWSILPFQGSAYAHEAHHSVSLGSNKSGNYASFFIWWDYMMGSILPDNDISKVAHYKDEASDGGWYSIPDEDPIPGKPEQKERFVKSSMEGSPTEQGAGKKIRSKKQK